MIEGIIKKQKENFLTSEEIGKLKNIPDPFIDFINAIKERPYSILSNYNKKEFCLHVITEFYKFSGISSDDKTLAHQTNCLFDELLLKQFNIITCSEIVLAFEMGKRNEFGQYFGPSQKTYNLFLNGYLKHQKVIDAKNFFKNVLTEKTIKTSEKPVAIKFTEDKNSVINAFDDYIENGSLPFACSRHYFFLWKEAGIVNWNQAEKQEIESEGKEKYISKLKKQLFNREISKQTFEKCTFNIDSLNASFINLCREIALKKLFDKLKNENKHLKTLFDDKGI